MNKHFWSHLKLVGNIMNQSCLGIGTILNILVSISHTSDFSSSQTLKANPNRLIRDHTPQWFCFLIPHDILCFLGTSDATSCHKSLKPHCSIVCSYCSVECLIAKKMGQKMIEFSSSS